MPTPGYEPTGNPMLLTGALLTFGGALGAVARYHATRAIARISSPSRLPLATLSINLAGSALLGALLALLGTAPEHSTQSPLYLLLGTGFCGAFTTFSTFALETHTLLHNTDSHQKSAAAAYVIFTITGCLALFGLCFWLVLQLLT